MTTIQVYDLLLFATLALALVGYRLAYLVHGGYKGPLRGFMLDVSETIRTPITGMIMFAFGLLAIATVTAPKVLWWGLFAFALTLGFMAYLVAKIDTLREQIKQQQLKG